MISSPRIMEGGGEDVTVCLSVFVDVGSGELVDVTVAGFRVDAIVDFTSGIPGVSHTLQADAVITNKSWITA
jgi:hypothetical protein